MNFNLDQYKKYLNAAGRREKDGYWDVVRYPNGLYCFATNQKLGDNGKIDSHPLLNKKFQNVENGKTYILDSVCIHWYMGYYYHATLRDQKDSHATVVIENINCEDETVLEYLERFNTKYKLIDND